MDYDIHECAICGFKAKTPRGFATHIRQHKLDKKAYIEIYGEYATLVIDEDKLTCPICGLPNFENVKIHMKHVHKLSDDEIKMYPEERLVLPTYKEHAAKGGKTAQARFLAAHPDHIPYTPKYKSRSEASKAMWQNPEYVRKQSEKCKKQHEEGLTERVLRRRSKFIYKDGTYMRSSWEIQVASYLDSRNIPYKYEGVCISYINPKSAKQCRYYPDFYIESVNTVIEVKPKSLINDAIIQCKRKTCIEKGFNFKFLTEDDLENLEEYFNSVLRIEY